MTDVRTLFRPLNNASIPGLENSRSHAIFAGEQALLKAMRTQSITTKPISSGRVAIKICMDRDENITIHFMWLYRQNP